MFEDAEHHSYGGTKRSNFATAHRSLSNVQWVEELLATKTDIISIIIAQHFTPIQYSLFASNVAHVCVFELSIQNTTET